MRPLTVVGGIVVETRRFINVPMRMSERYLARERRELWLREAGGQEHKWIIHTRALPARRGHRVELLLRRDWVVGLFNMSTGAAVNYPRADPPFLLRGVDLLVVLVLAVGLPAWLGALGLVLAALSAMAYLLFAACFRAVWRWRLRMQVDALLGEIRSADCIARRQIP